MSSRAIFVIVGIAVLIIYSLTGCTPQQSTQYMPLMSYGTSMATSMTNQAANLYFQQQRIQQQADLQRQQQEYQLELQRERQQYQQRERQQYQP